MPQDLFNQYNIATERYINAVQPPRNAGKRYRGLKRTVKGPPKQNCFRYCRCSGRIVSGEHLKSPAKWLGKRREETESQHDNIWSTQWFVVVDRLKSKIRSMLFHSRMRKQGEGKGVGATGSDLKVTPPWHSRPGAFPEGLCHC
jgi:hypothetical protein